MRYPSVKNLATLTDDVDTAKRVRRILDGTESPETVEQTAEWVRQCYYRPSKGELKMHACNVLLGGYGVEACWKHSDTYWPTLTYINMGDTYTPTLVRTARSYRVTDWGSIVERGGYR